MNTKKLFVRDASTGRIRFTRMGVEKYRARFAQAGYNIESIRTISEFSDAVDATFRLELESLSRTTRGTDPELDRIMEGLPGWEP